MDVRSDRSDVTFLALQVTRADEQGDRGLSLNLVDTPVRRRTALFVGLSPLLD